MCIRDRFRKLLDEGRAGDNVGLLLRGIDKEDVERGQVIAKPGSITPHTKFEAEVYVLTKEEGGRHNPFFKGYRPQFYFRTTDVTGEVHLAEGTEMVMPGDNVPITVELISPIAMTYLLIKVSGVSMLENQIKHTKDGYEEYIKTTSAFIILPKKKL